MGIHHEGSHGRVFRGLDANNHEHKRDSHGDFIKWNVPDHVKAAARPADAGTLDLAQKEVAQKDVASVATLTSVVYETLSADFDGPIAGYTTLAPVAPSTTAAAASLTNSNEAAYASAKAAASAGVSSGSASATITQFSTATLVPTSSQATTAVSTDDDGSGNKSRFLNAPPSAVISTSVGAAALAGTPLAATHTGAGVIAGTPISATHNGDSSNAGMTGGAKAGLAFSIILGLALFGGLIFFCLRRRKNREAHQEITNEKRVSNSSSFFGGNAMSEKRASASSTRSAPSAATAPRLSLRPVTQFLPNLGSKNTAGDHLGDSAAMFEKPKSMWERRSQNAQNPFDDNNSMSEKRPESPPTNPFEEPEGEKSAHVQSDSVSELGTAAAVAVAGGAASPPAQNNVHRVQLDFKPSMEDELELKSGQLVRMLHAYDDGWALCVRMDRSQQGVVPRTCLSKLPVKPRPQGPPQGSNGHPITPLSGQGMAPRPLTPNSPERSGSNADASAAVPARKPVPGQAM
ncbi:hypothetical protein LTR78_010897 [Recurvomyces mirabilis]|uniref:SH3 domain-containing protein n=1 Tax=Recurvomyces mirabilis TaxID=574656 RepID=A0AAE0TLW1_9PEZI|nr:hypothetical protein LTR78_010897 [Recurvomyces mirabilis]KAK5151704.1 hypothetical protein LTS14_009191 [Recurvomyces mirabilis]